MPNQCDPFYTKLEFNFDHAKNILILKQLNPDRGDIIRMYRIKFNRILSAYIEGPYGSTDDNNVKHDDMWRFVITVHYHDIYKILCERDIVLYIDSKEHAENSLDILNRMLGM